eukprot:Anaeramoba_ignava/a217275_25.p1 GENE.a217275_25~~a217275_25.p1  ORF type:complete len:945 (+),score=288.51 a217275_25:284-2836(+)
MNEWKVEFYDFVDLPLSNLQTSDYQKMITLLRQNLEVLGRAIIVTPGMKREYTEILSHSAIPSLLGHLCNDHEEFKMLKLIEVCFEEQLKLVPDPRELLISNKLLSRLISAYTKNTHTSLFLLSSLRNPILSILQDPIFLITNHSSEISKEVNDKIISITTSLLQSLEKKVPLLPYGIRFITKKIISYCHKFKREKDQDKIISGFLLVRLINPALITPERYGIIDDIPIMENHRAIFQQIAKILLSLCSTKNDPRSSIQKMFPELTNLGLSLSKFFVLVGNVIDKLKQHDTEENDGEKDDFFFETKPILKSSLVTPNDLFALHKLLFDYGTTLQNNIKNHSHLAFPAIKHIFQIGKPPELIPAKQNKYFEFSFESFLPQVPNMNLFKEKTEFRGKSFFSRSSNYRPLYLVNPVSFNKTDVELSVLHEQIEKKLRQTLCLIQFENLNEYKEKSLLEILEIEKEKSLGRSSYEVFCLLDSTIRTIKKRPQQENENIYNFFLVLLKQNYTERLTKLEKMNKEKNRHLGIANRLRELVEQSEMRMNFFEQFIQSWASRSFVIKYNERLKNESEKLQNAYSKQDLIKKIADFFDTIQKCLRADLSFTIFSNAYNILSISIENHVFVDIYDEIFYPKCLKNSYEKEDILFSNKINKVKKYLTPTILHIPEQFWSTDMWSLAIEELKTLNHYKTPSLKILVLAHCAKIIFNILEFNGITEIGADLIFPIVIYVILYSNPPNLPSNMHYVEMFGDRESLNHEHEYWLTTFKSGYTYLFEIDMEVTKSEYERELKKEKEKEKAKKVNIDSSDGIDLLVDSDGINDDISFEEKNNSDVDSYNTIEIDSESSKKEKSNDQN